MFTDIGGRTERELDRHDRVFRRWAVREIRARRFQAFLVDGPGGDPAGSGAIWLQPQQPRPGRLAVPFLPYVMSMYTVPERRGKGVATRLVRAMVRWAADRGYPRILLHASRMGRPVYARAGFHDGSEMRLELPVRRSPRRGR